MRTLVRRISPLAAILLSGACGEISGSHPPIAEIRLFTADGADLSPVVRIPAGDLTTVEARFFDASGAQVRVRHPEHAVRLRWSPANLLSVVPVPNAPFQRQIGVDARCVDAAKSLWIGYGHWGRSDEREFGPFEIELTHEVARAEIFGPTGEQLSPEVELPFGRTIRIESRFFGCAGDHLSDLPERQSILIFWSDAESVEVQAVPGERFMRDVTARAPVGTTGQMIISYGSADHPNLQLFGPFSVRVVE